MATYTGLDLAPPAAARSARRRRPEPPASLRAVEALDAMARRERAEGLRNALLLLGGFAIVAASAAALIGVLTLLRARFAPDASENRVVLYAITGGMAILAHLIALVRRRDSRTATIEQFLDEGRRPAVGCGGNEKVFVRWAVILAMIGMLLGAFLTTDAVANARVRRRVAGADRHRAADILAALRRHHAGLDPRTLLRHGEDPLELRRTIAYLLTFRWADLSPDGDHLVLLSPARQRLIGRDAGTT